MISFYGYDPLVFRDKAAPIFKKKYVFKRSQFIYFNRVERAE